MKSWFFRKSQALLASSHIRLTLKNAQQLDPIGRAIILASITLHTMSWQFQDLSDDLLVRPLDCSTDDLSIALQIFEQAQQLRKQQYKALKNLIDSGGYGIVREFESIWFHGSVALNVLTSSIGGALIKKHNEKIGEIWTMLDNSVTNLEAAMDCLSAWERECPLLLRSELRRIHPFFIHLTNNRDEWKECGTTLASVSKEHWRGR